MVFLQSSGAISIGLPELIQILIFAFGVGGLALQVRTNSREIREVRAEQAADRLSGTVALTSALDRMDLRHKDRVDALEARNERTEERTLNALENLSRSMSELATKLEVVVVAHESRFVALERNDHGE